MAKSNANSSAVYEAVLIDHITKPATDIIKVLDKLHAAPNAVSRPARILNKNMENIRKVMKKVTQKTTASWTTKLAIGLQNLQRTTTTSG